MKKILVFFIVIFITWTSFVRADHSDYHKDASELTILFRSARKIISEQQDHINDPKIGNKGLSGENLVRMSKEYYKKSTGRDLSQGILQQAMLESISLAMDDYQLLINEQGKKFKNFLPAIFAKKVADYFKRVSKGKAIIKLTAPRNYIRNRENKPDLWEDAIIERKLKGGFWPKDQSFSTDSKLVYGRKAFRLITPEYYSQSCLTCHGKPKGEVDKTGFDKEGGILNELGGAISVVIFE